MTKHAVIEICYTDTDVTTAKAKWAKLKFNLVDEKPAYADIAIYERKNGAHKQLKEEFGGKQPVLLIFES